MEMLYLLLSSYVISIVSAEAKMAGMPFTWPGRPFPNSENCHANVMAKLNIFTYYNTVNLKQAHSIRAKADVISQFMNWYEHAK